MPELLAAALVILLGSTLQSAAGFGFGMFAIPLLMLLGAAGYEAITIVAICSFAQSLPGLMALRRHIVWRDLLLPLVVAAIFMPLGVLVLRSISALEPAFVRQIFGAIILLALGVKAAARITPRERLRPRWGVLAGSCSGFLSGASGMGGPPLVMWIMAHNWTNERSRVSLWVFFSLLTPIQIGALWHRFGEAIVEAAPPALILALVVPLGLMPGLWIGGRIAKPLLRRLSYLIILVIALYAILQPLVAA